MADTDDSKKLQVEIASRLQLAWLKRMEKMLEDGTITSTDMATLARVLLANGWVLDPAQLPQGLRGRITETLPDVDEFDALPARPALVR